MFFQHGTHLVTNLHSPIRGEQGGVGFLDPQSPMSACFLGGDESIVISSPCHLRDPRPLLSFQQCPAVGRS